VKKAVKKVSLGKKILDVSKDERCCKLEKGKGGNP